MYIYINLLIFLLCIVYLYNINFYHILNKKIDLIILILACDRDFFLNITLSRFYIHVQKYERNISFTIIFFDSGTVSRDYYISYYNILNNYYLNPSNDNYIYKLVFSLLYSKYVLYIEDDRPFIENIERKLLHKNFLEEGIAILERTNKIYGITYKPDIVAHINITEIDTYLGKIIICIVYKPKEDYFYVNAPSLYKTKYLKYIKDYKSEYITSLTFKRLKLYYGYTFKNITCKNYNSFSPKCQSVSIHLDEKRVFSTKTKVICKNFLY